MNKEPSILLAGQKYLDGHQTWKRVLDLDEAEEEALLELEQYTADVRQQIARREHAKVMKIRRVLPPYRMIGADLDPVAHFEWMFWTDLIFPKCEETHLSLGPHDIEHLVDSVTVIKSRVPSLSGEPCMIWKHKTDRFRCMGMKKSVRAVIYDYCVKPPSGHVSQICPADRTCIQPFHLCEKVKLKSRKRKRDDNQEKKQEEEEDDLVYDEERIQQEENEVQVDDNSSIASDGIPCSPFSSQIIDNEEEEERELHTCLLDNKKTDKYIDLVQTKLRIHASSKDRCFKNQTVVTNSSSDSIEQQNG